jgi:hypothetical protein
MSTVPPWKRTVFNNLATLFVGTKRNSAGFARGDCPHCYDKLGIRDTRASLGFNEDAGIAKCFRCNYRFVLDYDSMLTFVNTASNQRGFKMPSGLHVLATSMIPAAYKIRAYLWLRGLTDLELLVSRVHFATSGTCVGRAVFPHWDDASGEWWGYSARAVPGMGANGPKVAYPGGMTRDQMYNQAALESETSTPVMIVEGAIDACRYLPDAVACLGKPGNTFFDLVLAIARKNRRMRPIVFCLDGDALKLARMTARRLAKRGILCGFVKMPAGMDPDDVNPTWLRREVARIGVELCQTQQPTDTM